LTTELTQSKAIPHEQDALEGLHEEARDAVRCHFEEGQQPKVIIQSSKV